jgi:spoIIIJ-associated protein
LFGAKAVSIRVTLREGKRADNHIEVLKDIIAKVLAYMGIDYEVTVEDMPDTTFINVNSSGLDGLLIGRRGETLSSLQHVVNRIFTSRTGQHSKITIDVGGYVRRQHRLLIERTRKVADRVRKSGKEFDFEPLKASDRRVIHLAASDFADVTTYTIGDGLLRKVVITLKASEFSDSN